MSERTYACLVCRRVLNRYQRGDGSIQYRHNLAELHAFDHDPVPRPADRIPGGPVYVCDFCAAEDTVCWKFTSCEIMIVAETDTEQFINNYGTGWGACPVCAQWVSARDLQRLHTQSLTTAGLGPHTVQAATARQMMAATLAEMKPGRTLLLDGMYGLPPELPARLLPKIRDRLGVLLDPDNDIEDLADSAIRPLGMVASALDISRLYAIDTRYTDMAIAAAESLPALDCATVRVPSPFGLLLWSHPVDGHRNVAVSWATDANSIHVAFYRALGTSLDRLQEQFLRQQAGWLVPTTAFTLDSHESVDAAHPAATMLTTFLLIAHRLTETSQVIIDKKIRAAYARAHRPAPEVRLVHLRPSARPDTQGDGFRADGSARREPDYRWWVPPFVRNQPCGPGRTQREPVLILPHINGPRGKPVRASTTVRILAQPKPRPATQTDTTVSHVDGER